MELLSANLTHQAPDALPTPLEKEVLAAFTAPEGEPFESIRQQLACAEVVRREFTGVGFFTDFRIPPDAPVRHDLPDMTLGDVAADFPGLQHGAGFLLFIREGVVSMLEGFSYDEPWPESMDTFNIVKRFEP